MSDTLTDGTLTEVEEPWVPAATTSIGLVPASLDLAVVRVCALDDGHGGHETAIELPGFRMQTYNTPAAVIAAAFRRLADRIEAVHAS